MTCMSNWILGLTGGIGSGKTTVANLFAAEGVPLVDADQVARDLVMPGQPALQQIAEHFGPQILQADGSLDRAALRACVFQDEAQKLWLNNLLHPMIRQELLHRCQNAQGPYLILVAPLLFENGLDTCVNRTLCIDVSEETQIARTCRRDGNSPELVRAIMASQLPRSERIRRSDDRLDNDRVSLSELTTQVTRLHLNYLALSSQHLR